MYKQILMIHDIRNNKVFKKKKKIRPTDPVFGPQRASQPFFFFGLMIMQFQPLLHETTKIEPAEKAKNKIAIFLDSHIYEGLSPSFPMT